MLCAPDERDKVTELLRAEGFAFAPERISPLAFKLLEEPFPLGSSLAAFFGLIYIQDRSSMLPPLVLAPPSGAVALDMCASPGGKTGLLAQLCGANGLVLGNEPNPVRLGTLRRNLEIANLFQTVTAKGPGEDLPLESGAWHYILLDPPCSGWGTVEKHPKVAKLWKGDKIKPLASLQRALLRRAAELLQAGGRLVYSTCTTNSAENEEQVAWAEENLGLCPESFNDPRSENSQSVTRLHVAGGEGEGQGFFVALLKKDALPATAPPPRAEEDSSAAWWANYRERLLPRAALDSACLDSTRLPPGELAAFGDSLIFMPAKAAGLLPEKLAWRGFGLGKFTGGAARPSPRLRALMGEAVNCPAFNVEEPDVIRRLLSGNSLNFVGQGREVGLYFRDLPLGLLRLRGGRVMWSEG